MRDFIFTEILPKMPVQDLARYKFVNDKLLGVPYGSNLDRQYDKTNLVDMLGALGNIDEFNFDPSYLDCVTHVETVLACLLYQELRDKTNSEIATTEFLTCLQSIRYQQGRPFFLARNHFFAADWIKNNTWFLEEAAIMRQFFQQTKLAETIIDRGGWLYRHPILQNFVAGHTKNDVLLLGKKLGFDFTPFKESIRYLPLAFIQQEWEIFIKNLPRFCIVVIIRANWDVTERIGTNLNVSHLGCCLVMDQEPMFYHAKRQREVMVERLKDYLQFCAEIGIDGICVLTSPFLE